jgi:LacI family transcriptional regulator
LQLIRQPETNNVAQLLQEMSSRYVDGIIWAVPEIADNRAWLKDKSCKPTVPVVFLTMETQPDQVIVAVDNYGGALLVTRHLITQGCQNIGLITGPMDWWEARERKRGWRDALESVGVSASESLVTEGNWSTSSGEEGLATLLARHPELDGLFACNDRMALGALKTAREHHLRVPEDLAIVGFDDMPDTTYYCPALSTVRQDMIELGRLAVRELGRAIEEHQSDQPLAPKTVLLQPELLVRESSRLRKP